MNVFAFFLLCGLLPWTFLANGLTAGHGVAAGQRQPGQEGVVPPPDPGGRPPSASFGVVLPHRAGRARASPCWSPATWCCPWLVPVRAAGRAVQAVFVAGPGAGASRCGQRLLPRPASTWSASACRSGSTRPRSSTRSRWCRGARPSDRPWLLDLYRAQPHDPLRGGLPGPPLRPARPHRSAPRLPRRLRGGVARRRAGWSFNRVPRAGWRRSCERARHRGASTSRSASASTTIATRA